LLYFEFELMTKFVIVFVLHRLILLNAFVSQNTRILIILQ
jgi:hypothetical protein